MKSGAYAEIVPDCGATLHAFGITNNNRRIQIIDHFRTKDEFFRGVEELGFKGCKLSPFVCRIRDGKYSFEGRQFQISSLKGGRHALHGFIYKKPFNILTENANENNASVSMEYSYKHEDPGYPFSYGCVVTYTLSGECRLQVKTVCTNISGETIPLQDGWHPYFNLGKKIDDIELEFQSGEQYVFDKEILPTGETSPFTAFATAKPIGPSHIDNSYIIDFQKPGPLCVLRNKDGGIELQIMPETSYPILQIYTPPHRNSIAIENLSGPPNAFNLGKGFIHLQAGKSVTFETAYRIKTI